MTLTAGDLEIVARSLDSRFLCALGEDLQWPPGWRAALSSVLAPATVEKMALLHGARRHLLVATEHGRARLRRWIDARHGVGPATLPPWLLRKWIAERVVVCGDAALLPIVIEALGRVPACVRETTIEEVAFLSVGAGSAAWTGSSTFTDRAGAAKPRVIVCGPAAGLHVVLHEVAHVWHSAPPHEGAQLVTAQGEAGFFLLASRQGWRPRVDAWIARGERLAEGLACAWLAASHFTWPLPRR